MKTVHTHFTVLNKHYPKVLYYFDNTEQKIIWQSENHPTIEELDELVVLENFNENAKDIREKRNKLLLESDFVVVKSIELNSSITQEWKDYRQTLRDITSQDGFPENIVWPIAPNV